jgi:hypothetical protein
MRNDKSDESNESCGGDGGRSQECRQQERAVSRALDVHTE